MYTSWIIIAIIYAIALIPSIMATLVFIQDEDGPQLNKFLTFLSIWIIMPFYMVWKLISKINK